MSQHTYTLKFTIKAAYADEDAHLDQVMDGEGGTLEDDIKAHVEKRIKESIPNVRGTANILFDSLEES